MVLQDKVIIWGGRRRTRPISIVFLSLFVCVFLVFFSLSALFDYSESFIVFQSRLIGLHLFRLCCGLFYGSSSLEIPCSMLRCHSEVSLHQCLEFSLAGDCSHFCISICKWSDQCVFRHVYLCIIRLFANRSLKRFPTFPNWHNAYRFVGMLNVKFGITCICAFVNIQLEYYSNQIK